MRNLSIILLITLLSACNIEVKNTYKVAYKSGKEGQTLKGSKQDLIDAIRAGASVKIGWGWKGEDKSIEHVSEPIWLGVLNENEVIAHLDPQVLSMIDWNESNATYSDSTRLVEEWRVVISTKGTFDAIWYNRETHEQIRRMPQNHTMTWFVNNDNVANAEPLYTE